MNNNNLSDVPDSFVEMIRKRKAEIGLALRQIAYRADMDPATLSRILSKKQNLPSNDAILRLAEVLEIQPPESLLYEAGRVPDNRKPLLRATSDLTAEDMKEVLRIARELGSKKPKQKGQKK